MAANPVNSIYLDPPSLPNDLTDRIATLATELTTVDNLINMGFLYSNDVQLISRKNLLENEIEMLEVQRAKGPRQSRMFQ